MRVKLSILIIAMFLFATLPVHANSATPQEIKETIRIVINDELLNFSLPPIKINNSVMLPIRALFQALSIPFQFDDGIITANYDGVAIKLSINQSTATINGKSVKLTQPATIVNNYTYVPVRFISEAFNAKVVWSEAAQTVHISYGSQSALFSAVMDHDIKAFQQNILNNPALANQAANHVIYNDNGVEWLELALLYGADPAQALQNSIWWNQADYVNLILDKKHVSVDDPYISESKVTYIGVSLYQAKMTRNIYRDAHESKFKAYRLDKAAVSSISDALYHYGFRPSAADMLSPLYNYEEPSVESLRHVLDLGANPNDTTVEVVTLIGENHITYDSITHPQDLTTYVPIITTAYRILSANPSQVNYEKFNLLYTYGASLSPLSVKELERLEYLYKDSQNTKLYLSIVEELHSRATAES